MIAYVIDQDNYVRVQWNPAVLCFYLHKLGNPKYFYNFIIRKYNLFICLELLHSIPVK